MKISEWPLWAIATLCLIFLAAIFTVVFNLLSQL